MKIVQVMPAFYRHGADILVADMHRLFLEKGVDSHVIHLIGPAPSGLPNVHSLKLKNPYSIKASLKLANLLKCINGKDARIDVIHAHLTPCQISVPIAARLARLKTVLVTTEHSTFNKRRTMAYGQIIDKILFSQYDNIICISEAVKESMNAWLPSVGGRLSTIVNGIDIKKFSDSSETRQHSADPVVISVGRLVSYKNYTTAIKACALLDDVKFKYIIVGEGEDEPGLRRLVSTLGLNGKVELVGFRSDVDEQLRHADIFLMPSLWEGFGLAALEAMATGLPVVASDVPGLKDLVASDEGCSFLVDPHDPISIAEKLRVLMLSRQLRIEMGAKAKLRAKEFSIEKVADNHVDLYEKLLERR